MERAFVPLGFRFQVQVVLGVEQQVTLDQKPGNSWKEVHVVMCHLGALLLRKLPHPNEWHVVNG
jgi:hypothetical protein